MKYAITMEHNLVFQHFGKCPQFLIVDIHQGKLLAKQLLASGEAGHGALATLLADAQVDVLVCGGIGGGARKALAEKGISIIAGQSGNVDTIIEQIQKGTIQDDPSGNCHHHHEGEEHDCKGHDHCH